MKQLYKAALLATLGLAAATVANAETYGDFIAGFTTQSGNDQLVDIGNIATLVNGESWTATQLGISASSVSSYSWGIIGDASKSDGIAGTSSTYDTIWSTSLVVPSTATEGTFGYFDSGVNSILASFPGGQYDTNPGNQLSIASSADNSWNIQTINGTLTTDIVNSFGNPNTTGATSDPIWQVTANASGPVELGEFTLNNAGTLTYTVPEPSAYALLTMAGVVVVTLRNKFRK
jgi:hypothetical protein